MSNDNEPTDEEMTDRLEHYESIGVLEKRFEDDEWVYYLTPEAEALAPEFYESWMQDVEDALLSLYNHDLIMVDYDEQLEATYSLTPAGQAYVEAMNEGE